MFTSVCVFFQQIASQYKIQYFEVSSKDNINIQKVVITLIKLITENPLSHAHMLN